MNSKQYRSQTINVTDMEWFLNLHWKWFLIRLIVLVVLAPFIGIILVRCIEWFESAWKSKERKRRWKACILVFVGLAVALGWFR